MLKQRQSKIDQINLESMKSRETIKIMKNDHDLLKIDFNHLITHNKMIESSFNNLKIDHVKVNEI